MNRKWKRKIILVGTNFVPLDGGIAQYTLQLAKFFNREKRLEFVLTHHFQNIKHPFPVKSINIKYFRSRNLGKRIGDGFVVCRKFNSIVYTFYIYGFYLIHLLLCLRMKNTYEWVFTSLYGINNRILIEFHLLTKQPFSVVFHGLDIIEYSNKN